jgi:Leucine-rich repeat (LRR) protein
MEPFEWIYKIGAMKSIESLDLSKNNLVGEIPTSLSNLTYVSYLDLSYNNLTGRILSGSQLDTLYMENPSIYTSNIGLCAFLLQEIAQEMMQQSM